MLMACSLLFAEENLARGFKDPGRLPTTGVKPYTHRRLELDITSVRLILRGTYSLG